MNKQPATERYPIEAKSAMFDALDDVQVVFHGINKSGSKSMASVLRNALFHENRSDEALSHYHMKPCIPLEDYRELVDSRRGRCLAVGHYLYGSLRPAPRRIWVTQFRHPLPRIVSAYQWIKNKHINAGREEDQFNSFSKFIYASRGVTHSQVMQFGQGFGRYAKSDAKKSLSASNLFELAIEALERDFSAIAIAERFEESIFTFAALLGIKSVDFWHADQRNEGRPAVQELAMADRDLVREIYHWDYLLYDWALQKFKEQCSKIEFGPSLDRYKDVCSSQYKDRLVGNSADDAVARWLTAHRRESNQDARLTK